MIERFTQPIPNSPRRIHIIRREEDIGPALEYLMKFDCLGFDTETYHSVDRRIAAFDVTNGARMRLAQFASPEGISFVFDLYKINREFLKRMFPNKYLLVGQNLKFEMRFLMYELGIYDFGPIFDTFIAEQLLSKGAVAGAEGRVFPASLDAIAMRRLGVELPKDEQASEWYRNELSQKQIEYAARDAIVVLPIYQVQRNILQEQGQIRVAELEFDCIPALASMENNGMRLNQEKWIKVCEDNVKKSEEVKESLWRMLGTQGTLFEGIASINLDSRQQVQAAFKNVGIELPLNKKGKVTISKELLKHIKDRPEVTEYIKYSKLAKAISSYGVDWIEKINPFDGRVHYSIKQIGAETGRMSCAGPNMMQIPKDSVARNCFEAEPGWVLIDADYSQCELRILAELCRDPNLLEAFDKGYDLHRFSASLIFKCLMEAVTDAQRSIAKNLNFGIVYGIGVEKFAMQAGIPLEQAEEIMNYYLHQAYPDMDAYLNKQARLVLNHLTQRTMTGRIRQYSGDIEDRQIKATIQRNAKNMIIQGTNADITKRALALMYRQVKGDNGIKMLIPIHDEIISEAKPDRAEEATSIQTEAMLQAEREYLHRVPSVVDCSLTLEWCKDPTEAQLAAAAALLN